MANVLTKPLGRIVAAGVLIVVLPLGWFVLQAFPVFSSSNRQVVVLVYPGDSIATIAAEMHAKGVIASAFALRLDSLIFGAPLVQPGAYEFTQGSSFSRLRSVLSAPPNVPMISVTPGMTLGEVNFLVRTDVGAAFARKFTAAENASVTSSEFASSGSLEGLIGPGQYLVTSSTTPEGLLTKMVSAFGAEAASVGLRPGTTHEGLVAYQLVVAASIVEKEGYYAPNMPKVARVIFNRLAQGGPLQMDATVLYYFGRDGGAVTHAMLSTPTPYNTYLNAGLTPTPICTVSTTALMAVLHAPPGSWLYFVVVDHNGTEKFATTFAQQLANERLAASRGLG